MCLSSCTATLTSVSIYVSWPTYHPTPPPNSLAIRINISSTPSVLSYDVKPVKCVHDGECVFVTLAMVPFRVFVYFRLF